VQDYRLLARHFTFLSINAKQKLIPAVDSLRQITDTVTYKGRGALGQYARKALADMQKRPAFYARYYGKRLTPLRHLITSFSFLGAGMYRDSVMFRNFESQVNLYGLAQQKTYGFLGFFHTLQVAYDGRLPFAAQLQQNQTPFRDKTVSIQMFALNSGVMLPYMSTIKKMMPASYVEKLRKDNAYFPATDRYIPYQLSNDDNMMLVAGINRLKMVTQPNSTILLRLNAAGSPYTTSRDLMTVTGFQSITPSSKTSTTTQAFQYVLLFRDSKAALPLRE
jgi:hypothetical protein